MSCLSLKFSLLKWKATNWPDTVQCIRWWQSIERKQLGSGKTDRRYREENRDDDQMAKGLSEWGKNWNLFVLKYLNIYK